MSKYCCKHEFMVRDFCIQQFPFIAEDFDALTTYELLGKVICFLKEIGIQVEDLTKAFNELKEDFDELYKEVYEYLDSLKDKIREKIDEMVEDGTFEDIIADYMNRAVQASYVKNRINNGYPYLDTAETKPITVSVKNGMIDDYIQYYEVKCFKPYTDCHIFEPDSTAPRETVVEAGDMRHNSRSMMEYQYNNETTFVACNGGLPGWYLFSNGQKVCSDIESEHELQGWFYLVKRKSDGELDWIENGNDHTGTQLDSELYEWGMPIWSPVRVNGVNVCTDNFADYASYENIVNNPHPRTLLCIDREDRPSIVIIPGRGTYAPGATYADIMHMSEEYKHIFNFDGGGSSVLLVGNITMCPSWRYVITDWRHNISIFRLTPNEEV